MSTVMFSNASNDFVNFFLFHFCSPIFSSFMRYGRNTQCEQSTIAIMNSDITILSLCFDNEKSFVMGVFFLNEPLQGIALHFRYFTLHCISWVTTPNHLLVCQHVFVCVSQCSIVYGVSKLSFRHRTSSIQDRRFASLQRTLFIYLINKYISLSDICLTVHH